jgi:hypothetical protein
MSKYVPGTWTPKREAQYPRTNTIHYDPPLPNVLPLVTAAPTNDVNAHGHFETTKLTVTAKYPGVEGNYITVETVGAVDDGNETLSAEVTGSIEGQDLTITVHLCDNGNDAFTTTYAEIQALLNTEGSETARYVVASAGNTDVAVEASVSLTGGVSGTPGVTGDVALKSDGTRLYFCIVASGLISWYEATFAKVS